MLGNLNLLHNLSERRTISCSVLSANTNLLSSLTLVMELEKAILHSQHFTFTRLPPILPFISLQKRGDALKQLWGKQRVSRDHSLVQETDSKYRNSFLPLLIKNPIAVWFIIDNQQWIITRHAYLLWLHIPFHLILFVEMVWKWFLSAIEWCFDG